MSTTSDGHDSFWILGLNSRFVRYWSLEVKTKPAYKKQDIVDQSLLSKEAIHQTFKPSNGDTFMNSLPP